MSYGIIGLGTMGTNLALNISKKHNVHVYNRSESKVNNLIDSSGNEHSLMGHSTILNMVSKMKEPRSIMCVLPHGGPNEENIKHLSELLGPYDTIIDCANEHYTQSQINKQMCDVHNVNYLGVGISGGAHGALHGPALMVGGNITMYNRHADFFRSFSGNVTHVDERCDSGHFTKMVHNGIEYVMLQAIADVYAYLNHDYEFMSALLRRCEGSIIGGYITNSAFAVLDNYDIDNINDMASMNGTGMWCVMYAMNNNINVPCMTSAVQARITSNTPKVSKNCTQKKTVRINIDNAYSALFTTFAMSVLEGLALIKHKKIRKNSAIDAWSTSTIIESPILSCSEAELSNIIETNILNTRLFVDECVRNGVSIPCINSALTSYDMTNQKHSQMSFLMAQRNHFGQHVIKKD